MFNQTKSWPSWVHVEVMWLLTSNNLTLW